VEQYVFGGGRGSGWVVKKLIDVVVLTTTTTTTTSTSTTTTTTSSTVTKGGWFPRQGRTLDSSSPVDSLWDLDGLQVKTNLAEVIFNVQKSSSVAYTDLEFGGLIKVFELDP
jgi:hypothetical protein